MSAARAALATFAAGCFWGVELRFSKLPGVLATRVGYIGGHTDTPSYKLVCSGSTNHAEAVEVKYDPDTVTYESLLDEFWHSHDPTTLNRQGPDVGTQYRSAIFYHDEDQKEKAIESMRRVQSELPAPIVTQIVPASTFWEAEEYHQQYLEKRHMSSCGV